MLDGVIRKEKLLMDTISTFLPLFIAVIVLVVLCGLGAYAAFRTGRGRATSIVAGPGIVRIERD